jgi:hypothetical protein
MSWIMVDIEADGPIPGDYSMVSFGAVVVEPGLERTFYGELRPRFFSCSGAGAARFPSTWSETETSPRNALE